MTKGTFIFWILLFGIAVIVCFSITRDIKEKAHLQAVNDDLSKLALITLEIRSQCNYYGRRYNLSGYDFCKEYYSYDKTICDIAYNLEGK